MKRTLMLFLLLALVGGLLTGCTPMDDSRETTMAPETTTVPGTAPALETERETRPSVTTDGNVSTDPYGSVDGTNREPYETETREQPARRR